MTDKITVLLHWNIDYAEFPRSEAENIVKSSYKPMISALQKRELGPVLMNITGHSIEYLQKHHPNLLDQVIKLQEDEKIEMVGSAYSHPILPLLPRSRRMQQLQNHIKIIEEVFGVIPKGIWPPELAISPLVMDEIEEIGYEWSITDHEHLYLSQNYFNEEDPFTSRPQTVTETLINAFWAKWYQIPIRYFKAYRISKQWLHRLQDPLATGINIGNKFKIVQSSVAWTNITIFALQHTPPFYTTKKLIKMIEQSELPIIPLYMSDIEFFGYRSHTGNAPQPETFVSFLHKLQQRGIELHSPTSFTEENFRRTELTITSGSWAPDKSLKIWTDSEDNKELSRRLDEVYTLLQNQEITDEMMKQLRIAENSDARGWSPINERKQEAFSAISRLNTLLNK